MNTQEALDRIFESPEYANLTSAINSIKRTGVLVKLNGHCVAASEIIQSMLAEHGVKSRLLECQAIVSGPSDTGNTNFVLIGFTADKLDANSIDTHVVVQVSSDTPFIVDASIGHILNKPDHVVIAPLDNGGDLDVIARARAGEADIVYRLRSSLKLPTLIQRSLIEGMKEEQKTNREFNKVNTIIVYILTVSAINFIANSTLIVLKLINP